MIMGMIFLFSKTTNKIKTKKMEQAIIPRCLNIMNMHSCEHLEPRKIPEEKEQDIVF